MKAVAEFVMRGRSQAIGLAVIAAAIPFLQWFSTSIVSLVLLRKGPAEGAFVLLWTILPMLLLYLWAGDITPLIMLFGTFSMAYVLRATVSWELTLLTSVGTAVVGVWLVDIAAAGVIDQLVIVYREFLLELQTQAAAQNQAQSVQIPTVEASRSLLLGVMTMGYGMTMVMFLMLARWWQSVLYNPGGFQQEAHSIRLSPVVAGVLAVAVLLSFSIEALNRLVQVLTVPLLIAGFALMHWTVKAKQLSTSWLVSFYLLAIFLQLYPVLVFLALLDSWFDIRKKIQTHEV